MNAAAGAPKGAAGWRTIAVVALVAVASMGLSLARWTMDTRYNEEEICPDLYCEYAETIRLVLSERSTDSYHELRRWWQRHRQGTSFIAPVATAHLSLVLPGGVLASYIVWSILASLASLWIFYRIARDALGAAPDVAGLAVALLALHIVFLRAFARPLGDTTGLLFTLGALALIYDIGRAFDYRKLFYYSLFVLLGYFSRISTLPIAIFIVLWFGVQYARTRRVELVECGFAMGVLSAVAFLLVTLAMDNLHTIFRALEYAHRPGFTRDYHLSGVFSVLLVSFQLYPLVWLAGLREHRFLASEAEWLHAAWIVFYLGFLLVGGGAMWNRYLLPVVPSILLLSLGPLTVARERLGRGRFAALVVVLVAFSLVPLALQLRGPTGGLGDALIGTFY